MNREFKRTAFIKNSKALNSFYECFSLMHPCRIKVLISLKKTTFE